jgi:hypothetical protein
MISSDRSFFCSGQARIGDISGIGLTYFLRSNMWDSEIESLVLTVIQLLFSDCMLYNVDFGCLTYLVTLVPEYYALDF